MTDLRKSGKVALTEKARETIHAQIDMAQDFPDLIAFWMTALFTWRQDDYDRHFDELAEALLNDR